jgi:dTDP-4-amino-4,6-dideoxygalactose transaminase
VGSFGALSFYPTKNLGALGDGGALVTDDDALAADVRAWRTHGERSARYVHELPARNSRLDDVHAAVLRLRLQELPKALQRRREISKMYEKELPSEAGYASHGDDGAPHLAVIRSPARDELAVGLRAVGIGTGVHYPTPLHQQPALRSVPSVGPLTNSERWAATCLSLPLHTRLTDEDVATVVTEVTRQGAPWR